ncbi:MAG: hypothetical protein WC375_11020 [Methanomassiliicoccales archaeon]|jgi:hypothetical protein
MQKQSQTSPERYASFEKMVSSPFCPTDVLRLLLSYILEELKIIPSQEATTISYSPILLKAASHQNAPPDALSQVVMTAFGQLNSGARHGISAKLGMGYVEVAAANPNLPQPTIKGILRLNRNDDLSRIIALANPNTPTEAKDRWLESIKDIPKVEDAQLTAKIEKMKSYLSLLFAKDYVGDVKQNPDKLRIIRENVPPELWDKLPYSAKNWSYRWRLALDQFFNDHAEIELNKRIEVMWSAFMGTYDTNEARILHDDYLMPSSIRYMKGMIKDIGSPQSKFQNPEESISTKDTDGQSPDSALDVFAKSNWFQRTGAKPSVLNIATKLRERLILEYGEDSLQSLCLDCSRKLRDELIKAGYKAIVVQGAFEIDEPYLDEDAFDKGEHEELYDPMHYWVEVDGNIVDISADQFNSNLDGEEMPPVVMGSYSEESRYTPLRRNFK